MTTIREDSRCFDEFGILSEFFVYLCEVSEVNTFSWIIGDIVSQQTRFAENPTDDEVNNYKETSIDGDYFQCIDCKGRTADAIMDHYMQKVNHVDAELEHFNDNFLNSLINLRTSIIKRKSLKSRAVKRARRKMLRRRPRE